jgi:hypothetical protein
MKSACVLLVVVMLPGCDILGLECKTDLTMGVVVTLVDSISGDPVQSDTIKVVATAGTYADSAMIVKGAPNWEPTLGLVERPGNFTLDVTATGYRQWTAKSIRVSQADRCGDLNQVTLVARMQR